MAASGEGLLMAASGEGPLMAASGVGPLMAASGVGPLMATSEEGPLMAASGEDPLMAASGVGPLMATSGEDPLMAPEEGPLMATSGEGPLMATSEEGPLMVDQNWDEHFLCGVCYELMVRPTTLTCGHSFCRHCLACWFDKAPQCSCPSCQTSWTGHPQINITLRNLIESLRPSESKARSEVVNGDSIAMKYLADFDRKLSTQIENSNHEVAAGGNRGPVLTGICLALLFQIILMTTQHLFAGRNMADELLIHKPLVKWCQRDVDIWMGGLGPWVHEYILPAITKHHIDGLLLNALTEDDIQSIMPEAPTYHQKAFYNNLQDIKVFGRKPPTDFWEFKALHPVLTLFLATVIPHSPRLAVFSLFLTQYPHVFLPFLHLTTPSDFTPLSQSIYATQFPDPTWGQYIRFSTLFLLFPYLTLIDFILHCGLLHNNLFVALVAIGNCIAMGITEALGLFNWYKSESRSWEAWRIAVTDHLTSTLSHTIMVFIVHVFYNWIPSVAITLWFYFNIYICSYSLLKSVLPH